MMICISFILKKISVYITEPIIDLFKQIQDIITENQNEKNKQMEEQLKVNESGKNKKNTTTGSTDLTDRVWTPETTSSSP